MTFTLDNFRLTGINDNLAVLCGAAALCSALLPCHSRVGLSCLGSHQLALDDSQKRRCDSKEAIHDGLSDLRILWRFPVHAVYTERVLLYVRAGCDYCRSCSKDLSTLAHRGTTGSSMDDQCNVRTKTYAGWPYEMEKILPVWIQSSPSPRTKAPEVPKWESNVIQG